MGSMSSFATLGSYIGLVSREVLASGRNVSRRMARTAFKPEVIKNGGIALVAKHPAISAEMRHVLYFNLYEVPELEILRRTLEPTDRVLEVGGGIGFLSTYLARICGDQNVTTVEANPNLEAIIRRNHQLNGVAPDVIVAAATCDATCKTATLFLAEDFWSTSTVRQDEKKTVVPTVNLNRLIDEFMPSYLILDIEGAEVAMAPALRLDGVEKLLIELHPQVTGNDAANGVVQQFVQAGFLVDFYKSKQNQIYMTR
jgi:FkbM family methyltransferase